MAHMIYLEMSGNGQIVIIVDPQHTVLSVEDRGPTVLTPSQHGFVLKRILTMALK